MTAPVNPGSPSWGMLVRAAVVGTQREAAPAIRLGDGELDALIDARGAAAMPEDAVLRAAAVAGLARRAGTRALDMAGVALDAAPPETLRRASPAAANDLIVLLGGGRESALLPEWLALAADAHVRVPEELLPRLLTFGTHRRELHAGIAAVIGARGAWLAAQEPEWSFALGADDPERAWHEGDRTARIRALTELRARDAAHARELLAAGWEREPPAERAAFVDALRTALAPDDEPFLEAALDDRRKDVRTAAAALLARLPQSRLAQRAIARAQAWITVKRRVLGGPSLRVELPEECTPAMQRDGIEPRPPARTGERAWWLQQSIAQVPPSHWTSAHGVGAAAMIGLARKTDVEQPLLLGFATATAQYGDDAWRIAWIEASDELPQLMPLTLAANAGAPPTPQRTAAIVRALDANEPKAGELATVVRGPWDVTLSHEFVRFMQDQLAVGASMEAWALRRELLSIAAARVAPETPGILEGWPENTAQDAVRGIIATFCDTVRLRAAMRDHLKAAR